MRTAKQQYILHQNVVSDDYVIVSKGKYELHYFVYATPWTDKEIIKNFRNRDELKKFYLGIGRGSLDEYGEL